MKFFILSFFLLCKIFVKIKNLYYIYNKTFINFVFSFVLYFQSLLNKNNIIVLYNNIFYIINIIKFEEIITI